MVQKTKMTIRTMVLTTIKHTDDVIQTSSKNYPNHIDDDDANEDADNGNESNDDNESDGDDDNADDDRDAGLRLPGVHVVGVVLAVLLRCFLDRGAGWRARNSVRVRSQH